MSEPIIYTSYRDEENSISNRSLLLSASEAGITDYTEKIHLAQYKQINNQIVSNQIKLGEITEKIRELPANKENSVELKNLQAFASRIAKSISSLERELIEREQTPSLQRVLAREKRKAYQRMEQENEEALARYREEKEKEAEELLKRYREQRAEVMKRVEQQRVDAENQNQQASEKPKQEKQVSENSVQEVPNKTRKVVASIPLSILGVLFVHLIYGLTNLAISFLFLLISYVPVLNKLVDWLFLIRKDTPALLAMFVATTVAYFVFTVVANKIIKKDETRKLTLILTGIILAILNVIFVIINLVYGDSILANILLAIAGIVVFCQGKNT